MSDNAKTIELSTASVFKVIFIILLLVFLFLIRDILLLLFISLIIVAGLTPVIRFLRKLGLPRLLAVILLFVLFVGILAFTFYLIIPPLVRELRILALNLPVLVKVLPFGLEVSSLSELLQGFETKLSELSFKLYDTTKGVISGLISTVAIIFISFYLLASKQGVRRFLKVMVPFRHRPYALDLWRRIEIKIGRWLIGQLVASLVVGLLTFIGLSLLGVPYALLLALAVGILELIPYGPFLAFIPAAILGFVESHLTGLLVVALYIVVQQIEGNIVTPQIMRRAVGLNPVLIILAFLVGAKLAGILGAIIAIPMAAAISVFIGDFLEQREE